MRILLRSNSSDHRRVRMTVVTSLALLLVAGACSDDDDGQVANPTKESRADSGTAPAIAAPPEVTSTRPGEAAAAAPVCPVTLDVVREAVPGNYGEPQVSAVRDGILCVFGRDDGGSVDVHYLRTQGKTRFELIHAGKGDGADIGGVGDRGLFIPSVKAVVFVLGDELGQVTLAVPDLDGEELRERAVDLARAFAVALG